MPEIELDKIISCSSEDPKFPASNLLKKDAGYKWKNKEEKTSTIIFQMKQSSKIDCIHIGNDGSAFVEILVGKSTTDIYEVLLVSSTFMSPVESRLMESSQRVRMFNKESLCEKSLEKSWDRIKVICTQPYNKTCSFGLSFIKFFSNSNDKSTPEKKTMLGHFKLLSDENRQSSLRPGSLFEMSKKRSPTPPLSIAASAREESRKAEKIESPKANIVKNIKRPSPSKDFEKETTAKKLKKQTSEKLKSPKHVDVTLKKSKTQVNNSTEEKKFSQILSKVVFVLSGYQNPNRAQIRKEALEMGATYKQDWTSTCTHLICAFKDTPKFKEVKNKGRIVTHQWIHDCYKKKRLLPWRKYKLGNAPTPNQSSDDDEKRESDKKIESTLKPESSKQADKRDYPNANNEKKTIEDDDETDVESIDPDEIDTDDELANHEDNSKNNSQLKDNGYLNVQLKNYFENYNFFIYGDFSEENRKTLERYIIAANGDVLDYMSEKVKFIITSKKWDKSFDNALEENKNLQFIRPNYIFDCHDNGKKLPSNAYWIKRK